MIVYLVHHYHYETMDFCLLTLSIYHLIHHLSLKLFFIVFIKKNLSAITLLTAL